MSVLALLALPTLGRLTRHSFGFALDPGAGGKSQRKIGAQAVWPGLRSVVGARLKYTWLLVWFGLFGWMAEDQQLLPCCTRSLILLSVCQPCS